MNEQSQTALDPERTPSTPDARASMIPPPITPRVATPPGVEAARIPGELRPSQRPVVPASVQVLDRLGDIVGVIALAWLCHDGKIDGVAATVAIGAILGVGTGLRHVGQRVTGAAAAGLGVVGLGLLYAGPVVDALAPIAERIRGLTLLALAVLAPLALVLPFLAR